MDKLVRVLGVQIHPYSLPQLLDVIEQTLVLGKRAIIGNVNIHAMNLAYELPWFRVFLNDCDIVFCDGFGVKLAAYLLGHSIPERFTPPDWMPYLVEMAARHQFTFFLLGARPSVAEKVAVRLKEQCTDVQIVGTHHGYFDKTSGSVENEAVLQAINVAKPNILIVGFGMPLQECWIKENWDYLECNIVLTVGAALDYIAGEVPRGPRWMTDQGFEWLTRLVIEPRRLWRRYMLGNPLFFWRVIKQRFHLIHLD